MKSSPAALADRADVILVGGGVMGCASALALADAGARVLVLERSVPGAEASSAAAGILGAQTEAQSAGPFFELACSSRARYPAWTERLRAATGIDVGFRQCGILKVAVDDDTRGRLVHEVAWQTGAGLALAELDAAGVAELEPSLSGLVTFGFHFPEDGRVDPPLLLRALHIAASAAGAKFRSGTYVRAIDVVDGQARGVILEDGTRIAAGHVVLAAGSWSTLVGGVPLTSNAVRPARGQIVELETREPVLRRVVFGPACYLVPRDDGRILVGSTLEFVGYRREVTARAVRDLLSAAIELFPALADASLGRTWSNFRPYTDTGTPFLGPTEIPGLVLATGHYRNGILLAPITADIVCAVVQGRPPPVDLAPFANVKGSSPA
ncbi:MAG TPA: glycine oxidase ThiO [Polyangiaceae bacterium]